ncbi:uncharacterized protein LOC124927784 [Impatiens glandulifera]|uniref:uncharacterized protein LOC124927784 n=1 Tax=Impatiens glandulifera TaxID=253017 RepID=UPI001FB12E80|nr:uncharacterized protein LOC124927784 [Impatiens glandulifera]
MVSMENKKGGLHEQLQLLRSITNSHAASKTSIVAGAAKYIKDLKQKVEVLSEDIAEGSHAPESYKRNSCPMVTVNTLEKGFLIHVFSEESCPGLLVFVLGSFEDIGLTVLEARVSCTSNFQLEAIGVSEENGEITDAQMVKDAVSKAINNWNESASEDRD